MKKILFFLTCIFFCVKLTAQENDSLALYTLSELDSLFNAQKKPADQLPYALALLKKGEKELDNKDTAFAKVLFKVGDTYQKLRDWPNATNFLEKSLSIWQEKMPVSNGNASCLHSLGSVFYYQKKYEQAQKYWQLSLETRGKTLGKEHPSYVSSLNNLGLLYWDMVDYKTSEYYYRQAVEIRKKVLGESHPDYAKSLDFMGRLYARTGEHKIAEPYYKQALEINKKALGEIHPAYAGSLNNLGGLYHSMGDYKSSESNYKQAAEIFKKALGETHTDYGSCLNNLGILYAEMGNHKEAEPYYKQALAIKKSALGETHPSYASSLNNLGNLYTKMGEYKSAEPYYRLATEIIKKALGETHPDYASSLIYFGDLYRTMGDYKKAEHLYKQASEIIKNTFGKEHFKNASILNNMGSLYYALGNYKLAESTLKDALEIIKKTLGNTHSSYALNLNSLGTLYYSTGDYKSAENYYKQGLEITSKALGEDHTDYALNLNNLGILYKDLGEYKSAEIYLKKGLEKYRNAVGEMHPDYALSLDNLGNLYSEMGNFKTAEDYLGQCFKYKITNLSSNFSWLPEKGKEAYWYKEKEFYQELNNFAAKASEYPKASVLAYNGNLVASGLLLETSKELEEAILNNKDSLILKVYNEIKDLKRTINHLVSTGTGKKDYIEIYEKAADSLDKILVSRLGEYATNKQKFQLTWKDVQNALVDNEAAIEFAKYKNESDSQYYYMAMVLRKDFEYAKLVKLGAEKEIEAISAASGFSELYKLIWEPIDSLMVGVKTVYYSPKGYLNNISFAALCGKGSEEVVASTDNKRGNVTKNKTKTSDCVYLADRFTLHQLSTTRYLAEGLKESKLDNSILVFGGVNYDVIPSTKDSIAEASFEDYALIENVSRSSANQNKMEYLPGTKLESENLRKILSKKKWQVRTYSDVNASENVFKSELHSKPSSVLHIATHGFAFPEPEEKKKSLVEENNRPYRDSDNPMARCGLLLAGANNSWLGNADSMLTKSGEDGILSALEVSQLNLRKTKLVVLSACETGLGKIEGSEGTFGLKRGFKLAGVEQIIVSLWSVPDKETMELMTLFYNDLSVTLNPVISFEKAQKEMRKKYPTEPEKWAGFVLVR